MVGRSIQEDGQTVKRTLYKSIGGANFTWSELEEVILDVEITLNNRPLTYLEDDVQFTHPDTTCYDVWST